MCDIIIRQFDLYIIMPKEVTFDIDGQINTGWIISPGRSAKNKDFYMLKYELLDHILKHHLSPAGLLVLLWMCRNTNHDGYIRKWSIRNIAKDLGCSYFKAYAGMQDLKKSSILNDENDQFWMLVVPGSASKY